MDGVVSMDAAVADPTLAPARVGDTIAVHWWWAGLWGLLTTFTVFEVIKHGFVNGSAIEAVKLSTSAVAFFVAPDLTFVIGTRQEVPPGNIAAAAVPWYNAMHRMALPLVLTVAVGIGLSPLSFGPLVLFVGGLSWMAHIALDRAGGYGLREPDGSRHRA